MKRQFLLFPSVMLGLLLIVNASAFAQTVQRNFTVTAVIPPKVSDYQFEITSDASNQLHQFQTIAYEVTYGALATAGVTSGNTIVIDYSDTSNSNGISVVDYVIGSATTGLGSVQPVVDLRQKTITWTIPNLPAGAIDQKLTFKLNTNANYTINKPVHFTVQGQMSNAYIETPVQSVSHEYLFDPAQTTSNSTQITPTPVTSITPTQSVTPLQILAISYSSITDNEAGITVLTNSPSKQTIRYGTAANALHETTRTDNFAINSLLTLKNLKQNTPYYFRIVATDASGKTAVSDLFSFTTARTSTPVELVHNAVVVTSGDTVILSDILNGNEVPFGIITTTTNYMLTYTFSQVTPLAKLEVIFRDKIGNDQQTVTLNQKTERAYAAQLRTGRSGMYDLFARITDLNGNVIEQKIARLKVTQPLQVLEKDSLDPIGDARVLIKFYNTNTNAYELVSQERFGGKVNPGFTSANGELAILLPPGQYQAEISAIGYDGQNVSFTLGEGDGQELPTVVLNKNFANLTALIQFAQDWIVDTYNFAKSSLIELSQSIRFFNSIASTALLSFILGGFAMFGARTEITLRNLVPFFLFHLFVTTKRHRSVYIYGLITDKENRPLSQVRIEVLDLKTDIVLAHTASNKSGRFAISNTFKQQNVKLAASKDGFSKIETLISTDIKETVNIVLEAHSTSHLQIRQSFLHAFGEFFEVTLLLCLIAELFFLTTFGIAKTLPFIILSVFNLLAWIFFVREKKLH